MKSKAPPGGRGQRLLWKNYLLPEKYSNFPSFTDSVGTRSTSPCITPELSSRQVQGGTPKPDRESRKRAAGSRPSRRAGNPERGSPPRPAPPGNGPLRWPRPHWACARGAAHAPWRPASVSVAGPAASRSATGTSRCGPAFSSLGPSGDLRAPPAPSALVVPLGSAAVLSQPPA